MRKAVFTLLLVLVLALFANWLLDTLRGKPVDWINGLVVGIAGVIGAFAGLRWREKGVR